MRIALSVGRGKLLAWAEINNPKVAGVTTITRKTVLFDIVHPSLRSMIESRVQLMWGSGSDDTKATMIKNLFPSSP